MHCNLIGSSQRVQSLRNKKLQLKSKKNDTIYIYLCVCIFQFQLKFVILWLRSLIRHNHIAMHFWSLYQLLLLSLLTYWLTYFDDAWREFQFENRTNFTETPCTFIRTNFTGIPRIFPITSHLNLAFFLCVPNVIRRVHEFPAAVPRSYPTSV